MNDVERTIQAYLDGELPPERAAAVRRRVEADPVWRRELDRRVRLWGLVDGARPTPPAPALWPAVASDLDARRRSASWTWPQRGLAAAALAAGVMLGLELGPGPADQAAVAAAPDDYLADSAPTLDQLLIEGGHDAEDVES